LATFFLGREGLVGALSVAKGIDSFADSALSKITFALFERGTSSSSSELHEKAWTVTKLENASKQNHKEKKETHEIDNNSSSSVKNPNDLFKVRGAEASRVGAGEGVVSASSSSCPLGLDFAIAIRSSLVFLRHLEARRASSSGLYHPRHRCLQENCGCLRFLRGRLHPWGLLRFQESEDSSEQV
jgi:hypothetical protein